MPHGYHDVSNIDFLFNSFFRVITIKKTSLAASHLWGDGTGDWCECRILANHNHVLAATVMIYFAYMMASSNGNIFRVTGPLCGEFTGHRWISSKRPVTRSFDVFFDQHLNKLLSKQSRRRWFWTSSRSLWRHCKNHPLSQTANDRTIR